MKQNHPFHIVLSDSRGKPTQQLELFALLNLGIAQSLASGVISATESIQRFYHADNCLYVRKHLRSKQANAIMSHGVQLPDLFDCLPAEEAIRSLCLKLLEKGRRLGVSNRDRIEPERHKGLTSQST